MGEPRDHQDDGRGMVVFIHGQWLHTNSWQPWVELFDRNGYDCMAPPWPGESATVPACRADPSSLADTSLDRLTQAITTVLGTLSKQPILIGHGIGGLIARMLLDSHVASAAIAVSPLPCGPASVRRRGRPIMPTAAQFRRWFGNAVDAAESDELHRRLVIPAGCRPLLTAPPVSRVTSRGPLLLVSGSRDEFIPESSTSALQRRYRRRSPDQVTDHQVFPGRGHSLVIDARWLDVAYFCLDWLTRQNL